MNDIPYFEIYHEGDEVFINFDSREWQQEAALKAYIYKLHREILPKYIGTQNSDRLLEQIKLDMSMVLKNDVHYGHLFNLSGKWATEAFHRNERNRREDEERIVKDKVKEIAYIAGVAVVSSVYGIKLHGAEPERFSWDEAEELYKVLGEALKTRGK